MSTAQRSTLRTWVGSIVLLLAVLGVAASLAAWKRGDLHHQQVIAASHPEPMQSVTVAVAAEREYRPTTTAIGTVVALRSITLHNELPGTVHATNLKPGAIVEPGTVLVALDVAVETAELKALQAQAELAEVLLARMQRASAQQAAAAADVDRARAERDIALARVAGTEAVIARKTIRAPFRARVGMADVHLGQYLPQGTQLTTLQGIDEAAHVDFRVTQAVAAGLRPGDQVEVLADAGASFTAKIVAVDARVDPATRNATVRARLELGEGGPAPGAAVRVRVPMGPVQHVVTVPVSSLRQGPDGDHVFIVTKEADGATRAHLRQVQSGTVLGDDVVVRAGLTAGEQIAASGSFKLYESALLAVPGAAPTPGHGD